MSVIIPSPLDPPFTVPYTPNSPAYTVMYNGLEVPQELYDNTVWASKTYPTDFGYNVSVELLLAIAWRERNFTNGQSMVPAVGANKVNDFGNGYENSWGPWQLLIKSKNSKYGGVGDPYKPQDLLNVRTSAAVTVYYIAQQLNNGKDYYHAVCAWHSRDWFWPEFMNGGMVRIIQNPVGNS